MGPYSGGSTPGAVRRRRNTTLFVIAATCLMLYLLTTSSSSSYDSGNRTTNNGNSHHAHSESELFARAASLPEAPAHYKGTHTLIVVPGHGVFKGLDATDWANETSWGLEGHLQGHDGFLIHAFSQHIKRSLRELRDRGMSESIVVFSGGQTRPGAGPRSEGLSYYVVAEQNHLFGLFNTDAEVHTVLTERMFAEEFARDSYENLLFSVARFREITGHYPRNLVVVNWAYKQARFVDLHRVALRWHKANFEYVGIDMKDAAKEIGRALPDGFDRLSDQQTLERTKTDLYLCRVNRQVRIDRNPLRRVVPYVLSCPEIRGLLAHCGPELFDEKQLPWGN